MNRLLHIFFLFSVVIVYGQVSLNAIVDQTDFKVDEPFTLTFVMELSGENLIQESGIKLPDFSKFEIIGTASETNESLLGNTYVKQVVYQVVLRPKKTGTIKIGSALVTVNGEIYNSESFDIYVRKGDGRTSHRDISHKEKSEVYLNVELENPEVYKNQPTIAVLRAYSKNYHNFRKVKNIQTPKQDNVYIKPVSYQKSDIEPSQNQMASQVLAIYMIFPNENGNIEVEPISANVSNREKKIVSNKVKIKVKDLPENAPKDFKNAVGNFEIDIVKHSPEKVEVKKPINISVKISGEGNFDNIELPKLKASSDYAVYQPKIIEHTKVGKNGIKGNVLANYVIIPKKSGNITIRTESFSFFNPTTQKYIELGEKSVDVNAFTHDEMLSTRTPIERVNEYTNNVLETVDNPVIKTDNLKVQTKEKFRWKTFALNISLLVGLVLAYLLFRRGQKNKNTQENTDIPIENVTDTENKIRSQFETGFDDYFTHLTNLVQKREYDKFFETINELDTEIKEQYSSDNSSFIANLENEKGQQMVEEYQNLQQKIQIEKYAPVRQSEQINSLLESVIQFYSKIRKS